MEAIKDWGRCGAKVTVVDGRYKLFPVVLVFWLLLLQEEEIKRVIETNGEAHVKNSEFTQARPKESVHRNISLGHIVVNSNSCSLENNISCVFITLQ